MKVTQGQAKPELGLRSTCSCVHRPTPRLWCHEVPWEAPTQLLPGVPQGKIKTKRKGGIVGGGGRASPE